MTPEAFAFFSPCLEYLPSAKGMTWDKGAARFYLAMLEEIPDTDTPMLIKAIGKVHTFRPTPAEIIDTWRRMTSISYGAQAEEAVGQILQLRDRYGEYVVPHPEFPRILQAGEPNWTDPIKQRIIATFGGWVHFCRDDSPDGVIRGQLLKVSVAVMAAYGDETINRLRIEYRQARAELGAPDDAAQIEDCPRMLSLGEIAVRAKGGD